MFFDSNTTDTAHPMDWTQPQSWAQPDWTTDWTQPQSRWTEPQPDWPQANWAIDDTQPQVEWAQLEGVEQPPAEWMQPPAEWMQPAGPVWQAAATGAWPRRSRGPRIRPPAQGNRAIAIVEPEFCGICTEVMADTRKTFSLETREEESWTRESCGHRFCKPCVGTYATQMIFKMRLSVSFTLIVCGAILL